MPNANEIVPEIRLQQVLSQDGTVFSMQSIDVPDRYRFQVRPEQLLERYFELIYRSTWSVIRPVVTETSVSFTLFGSRLALLKFAAPEHQRWRSGEAVELSITGGFLVQARQSHRGKLSFLAEPLEDYIRLTVQLSEFCPLLLGSTSPSWFHRTLYRWTQAYIHRRVTVGFLAGLYQDLVGKRMKIPVRKVRVREGEDI